MVSYNIDFNVFTIVFILLIFLGLQLQLSIINKKILELKKTEELNNK